jgi:hypothetical protein
VAPESIPVGHGLITVAVPLVLRWAQLQTTHTGLLSVAPLCGVPGLRTESVTGG